MVDGVVADRTAERHLLRALADGVNDHYFYFRSMYYLVLTLLKLILLEMIVVWEVQKMTALLVDFQKQFVLCRRRYFSSSPYRL
jgi:hypothetical protein